MKGSAVLTSIELIDVSCNKPDEETALNIVRAVRPHDKLTYLGLAECKIGPTGAKEIAEYVKGTVVLTSLDLADNYLDAEAGKLLASMLEVNAVLTDLGWWRWQWRFGSLRRWWLGVSL